MCVKIKMCFNNCNTIFHATFKKKFHSCHPVQYEANDKYRQQGGGGNVFMNHHQVVPEIEIGFSRIVFRKCSAPDMKYFRLWYTINFIPFILHSPAQINFFHMSKKLLIKTIHFMKH